jgi:hypothetical protein
MLLPLPEVLKLARPHSTANDSAALCFHDAERCAILGDEVSARRRACMSIAHAVGIFHPDFVKASKGQIV